MLLEIGYGCFEDGRLVHLPVVLADHGAELRDQHVELVPPLLLGQVPGLPLGLVLLIVVIQVGREYTNIKYSSELAGGADHMRTPLGRF